MTEDELRQAAEARRLPISNIKALRQALTHKSLVPDRPLVSNERLEFLGDSVLGLIVNEFLCATFPDRGEGELAKGKAIIVCKGALADAARALDLMPLVSLGRSEEQMGGRNRASIAADTYEALLAAIYLERGYDVAREFVLSTLAPAIDTVREVRDWRDPKTILQELRQAERRSPPLYRVTDEYGRAHDRTFTVEVLLDDVTLGSGTGKSKKDAEQAAAQVALERIGLE